MKWLSGAIVGSIIGMIVIVIGILSYLSSKKFDMAHYCDRVRYCCAFPDYLTPGVGNILNMAHVFNMFLTKPYVFTEEFGSEFVAYYEQYRDWILCKYFDPNVRFSKEFPNLLSRKNRKYYDQRAFEHACCSESKAHLFFAQSFYYFSKSDFEKRGYYGISAIECQMRLGSINMMKTIDPKNNSYIYDIAEVEELFRTAKEREKSDRIEH